MLVNPIDVSIYIALFLFGIVVVGVAAYAYGIGSVARLRMHGQRVELKGKIEQAKIRSAAAVSLESQKAQLALNAANGDENGAALREKLFTAPPKISARITRDQWSLMSHESRKAAGWHKDKYAPLYSYADEV